MPTIFSDLNIADSDRVFAGNVGQGVIYDTVTAYVNRQNAELARQLEVFISMLTDRYTEKYKLPGTGYMQETGGSSASGAVRPTGDWTVGYPLRNFDDAIASSRVAFGYMTAAELQNAVDTVVNRNANTVRYQILQALLDNTNDTFDDKLHGDITVKPLANGDSDTYPPILGAAAEATEDHYLVSGYIATAISDSNNPFATTVPELEHHFGQATGGANIVSFIHPDESPEVDALADFVEVPDNFIRVGNDTDVPTNLINVPGRIIGRMKGAYGSWVSEWYNWPSGYMGTFHLEEEAPLKMRVDPSDTGLGVGLQLVAEDMEYPFSKAHWTHRFGVGVANRLNGVVLQFKASGSYDVPTVV